MCEKNIFTKVIKLWMSIRSTCSKIGLRSEHHVKKTASFPILLGLITLTVFLTSCKKDNDKPSKKPVKYMIADIDTDVVWYADTIYVIKDQISINGKLTIRPGTIVKFENMSSLLSDEIIAIGTLEQPIVFTSIYDDDQGGDIDGDNGVIKPQAGDWLMIGNLSPAIQYRFEYCEFYYGGTVVASAQLDQKIVNCTFAHSKGYITLDYALMSLALDPSRLTFGNNLFYDNVKPLCIYPNQSVDATNTFSLNGTYSKLNGIFVFNQEYTINSSIHWQETEVPFVVQDDLTIADGGHLEFADNVVLKFLPGVQVTRSLIGSSSSLNGDQKDVIFTSFKDDEHGGDTNGDEDATIPHDGDWEGIYGGIIISWWTGNNILYDNH